jgi:hypothetical protein
MRAKLSWVSLVASVPLFAGINIMEGHRQVALTNLSGNVAPVGDMAAARFDHTATLLPDGRVLIVGGLERNGVIQSSAELFDPATGRFAPAGKLQSRRGWGITAAPLPGGRVLIAGGANASYCGAECYLQSAELYDSSTNSFVPTGSMSVPRAGATALLLPNGNVLVVGGNELSGLHSHATAELYHPQTGVFSPAGELPIADAAPQLVLLKTGQVLVIGKSGCEIYDPSANRFVPTGGMIAGRAKFGAALLSNGKVLVAGGQVGGAYGARVASTEIYDPASGTFAPGPNLNYKRFKLAKTVLLLRDGRILIGGGNEQPEVYDVVSRRFVVVDGHKLDGFLFSTATLLKDGRVLLAGGYSVPGGSGVSHAWLYQP